jgi:FlaA1/EpsC-like NDP-sugar epimerase
MGWTDVVAGIRKEHVEQNSVAYLSFFAPDQLASVATRRAGSMFAADIASRSADLWERLSRCRVLVVGGAGSIGGATVRELASIPASALHIVDQNENALAELVRDLRSRPEPMRAADLRTLPLDFGAPVMRRFLEEQPAYDVVLNFAALKHVRSEKDLPSLLQMLDTNVVKAARMLRWLGESGFCGRYFCVSTDKAANPVNLMGATKRLMEHVTFSAGELYGLPVSTGSARFANVAFSSGSLLESFLHRLARHQPLAVPAGTRRFFVSLQESAHICILAAICGADRQVVIPRLAAANDLQLLEEIVVRVLAMHGLEPAWYDDEDMAKASVQAERSRGRYPVLVTPLNTSGEKEYEEFVADGETTVEIGMEALLAIAHRTPPTGSLQEALSRIEATVLDTSPVGSSVSRATLIDLIRQVVPELRHRDTGRSLDEGM